MNAVSKKKHYQKQTKDITDYQRRLDKESTTSTTTKMTMPRQPPIANETSGSMKGSQFNMR